MTLKDLLLQFAGENEQSLKLDEVISNNIENICVYKNFNNGIELLITQGNIDEIIKKIDVLLIESNYDSYDITKVNENIIRIELTWNY